MDLIYFLRVLYKRIWLILLVTVIAVAATFFITGGEGDIYKATAQIDTKMSENPDIKDNWNYDKISQTEFNRLIEVMKSQPVINLLSYKLVLSDLNSKEPFRNSDLLREDFTQAEIDEAKLAFKAKVDSLKGLSFTDENDRVLIDLLRSLGYDYEALLTSLSVQRFRDSDLLNVEFKSENPYLSAFAVNTLSKEFLRYYRTIKTEKKQSSVSFTEQQVKDKLAVLEQKKEELNRFKLNNSLVDLTGQQSSILKTINDLELKREEERKKIPSYQSAIRSLSEGQSDDSDSYADIQRKNKRINNLRNEINYLNDKYITEGSKDKKIQEQISTLKEELRQAISEAASGPSIPVKDNKSDLLTRKVENEMELELARASVQSIDKELQRLENELKVLVSLEPAVTAMEREITFAEEDYKEAVKGLSLAKSQQLFPDDRLKIAKEARPNNKPEPTKQMFFAMFSGMLSFSFCIVLIFMLEYVDLTIKTPTQFEKFTDLKLLGYLNQINFISFNLDVNFIDINLESIFHNKNDNQQLESFKQLIRKIRFEVESADAKRFLVTSTREGEGKTFLITSLAYSLSLNNKKVLIVDTNFKNNTLTNMLSAKPTLEKHFNQELIKDDIIMKTKLKGVDIIGCYEGNYSPSEVFSQTNFHNLINDLSHKYDFIFLEGAALNEYSDSKELISSVEKVICVFSTTTVIKDEDKASIAYLRGLGDRFMGPVLNKVELNNLG